MTVYKDFPNLPEEKLLSNVFQLQSSDSCVVLVGTTGTGKTTCLNLYTGNSLPTGESAVGVTKEISCVADLHHQEGPRWIDNPGWADAEGKSDGAIFKSLLRTG